MLRILANPKPTHSIDLMQFLRMKPCGLLSNCLRTPTSTLVQNSKPLIHILAQEAGREASRAQRHVGQLWQDAQHLLLQLHLKLQEVNAVKCIASELENHADEALAHYLSLLSINPVDVKQVH